MKNEKNYNQYQLCLKMAEFIRKNPDSILVPKLKQCKNQDEQAAIFEQAIVNRSF